MPFVYVGKQQSGRRKRAKGMSWDKRAQRKRDREKNAKRAEQVAARRRVTDVDGNLLPGDRWTEHPLSVEPVVLET